MTFKTIFLKAVTGAALAVAAVAPAHAVIFGAVYENDFSSDASVIPAGPPSATFTVNAIDFNSGLTGYTIGGFLNGATFITGAGVAGNTLDNTHFTFTGSTFLNAGINNLLVTHDDGLVLSIDGIGTVVNEPLPTSPVDTPFVVNAPSSGFYNFTLDYNETLGSPGVLKFKINGGDVGEVPEPATWALMLGGFGITGMALRRRTRSQIAQSIA